VLRRFTIFRKNRKNRKNRINDIVKDIPEIKRQQLLAEIRLLKIESYIAIIVTILSIISFTILNFNKILNIFTHSKVKIQISDNAFYNNGKVIISKVSGGKLISKIICNAKEMKNFIDIEPGSYNFQFKWNSQVWTKNFILNSNETEVISIPKEAFTFGNIKIFITNNTPILLPGEMLELIITVTGNGYLWCYELIKNKYSRIYPVSKTLQNNNEIKVDKPFRFPNENDFAIFAGEEEKEETLLFIVTSEKNQTLADKISNNMRKNIIHKAQADRILNNWGVSKIVYSIKKP